MNKKILLILTLIVFLAVSVAVAVDTNDTENLTVVNETPNDGEISLSDDKALLGSSNNSLDDGNLISVPQKTDNLKEYPVPSVTITKVWNDNNDASGKRPSSIKVIYSIRGDQGEIELTEAEGWTKTIIDLYVENPGDFEIIEEVSVPGYTTEITGDPENGFTITNTIIDEDNEDNDDSINNDTDNDTPTKDDTNSTNNNVTKNDEKPKPKKPVKDEYNTGNPILLGLLAISGVGLAVKLHRKK